MLGGVSPPDAIETLDAIARDPEHFERVVVRRDLPARAARTAPLAGSCVRQYSLPVIA